MTPLRWSVLGVGIAGRARCRAIQATEGSELVTVWRGRFAGEVGAPVAASLDEAFESADAVAIASPTEHHAAQAEVALRAGRHVIVEFPVARELADARALFRLADDVGKVLHVEHIELLEPAGATLSRSVHPAIVQRVHVSFQRPGSADAGPPALALGNVARLHRLCAVAGPIQSIEAVSDGPGELLATLRLVSGAEATLSFTESPYLQRRTTVIVDTPTDRWEQVDGELRRGDQPLSLLGARSLFLSDQIAADATIRSGAPSYVSRERILHVLQVMERLGQGLVGAIPVVA